MKLVWSRKCDADLFGHVFPVEKYRLIREEVLARGIARQEDLVEADPALVADLLLVHTPEYIDDLLNLRTTHRTMRSEMALTRDIVDAYVASAGGTIQAARRALDDGVCVHIGGGFHHAYPDHAEGFCYVNDPAVAIIKMKREGLAGRVCVIDCDLHQGNGTAFIFARDPDVFTFSIHQENNYPVKERSDLDIGLPDGADDALYLEELQVVGDILDRHRPDMAVYLAGADPYLGDKLGGLSLTKSGLQERDKLIFGECTSRKVPVCVVFAGGYATDVKDVVDIHVATIVEASRAFRLMDRPPGEAG
jgi:acetoin utilization deacetylase AcuC-like enzyme